jgi:hypothetical protein
MVAGLVGLRAGTLYALWAGHTTSLTECLGVLQVIHHTGQLHLPGEAWSFTFLHF